nr:hypothetical protein BaRGS_006437 [Batillaria attramentaria]
MDGEKDPRNLMLAFRCAQIVCNHFNLGAMEEDMFEVTACYFPIDFVPLEPEVDFLTETVALLQQVADSQSPAVGAGTGALKNLASKNEILNTGSRKGAGMAPGRRFRP